MLPNVHEYDSTHLRKQISTNVRSSCSTRVYRYNDASLKAEGKRGSTVLDLDSAVGIGMIIGVQPQECSWLKIPFSQYTIIKLDKLLTSGTRGIAKDGTPAAPTANPPAEPHIASPTSSTSSASISLWVIALELAYREMIEFMAEVEE